MEITNRRRPVVGSNQSLKVVPSTVSQLPGRYVWLDKLFSQTPHYYATVRAWMALLAVQFASWLAQRYQYVISQLSKDSSQPQEQPAAEENGMIDPAAKKQFVKAPPARAVVSEESTIDDWVQGPTEVESPADEVEDDTAEEQPVTQGPDDDAAEVLSTEITVDKAPIADVEYPWWTQELVNDEPSSDEEYNAWDTPDASGCRVKFSGMPLHYGSSFLVFKEPIASEAVYATDDSDR